MRTAQSLVLSYYHLVDAGKTDELLDLFSDNAVYERQGTPTINGKSALRRFYEVDRSIAAGVHDIECILAGQPWTAVRGQFRGVLKSGEAVAVAFTDWHAITHGKIRARQTLFPDVRI
jgi:uncharacterized protein